jgi:hypothetical protein
MFSSNQIQRKKIITAPNNPKQGAKRTAQIPMTTIPECRSREPPRERGAHLVLADERLAVPEGEGCGDEDEEEERQALGPLEVIRWVEVAPRPRRRGAANHGGRLLSGEEIAGDPSSSRPPARSRAIRACARACPRRMCQSPSLFRPGRSWTEGPTGKYPPEPWLFFSTLF